MIELEKKIKDYLKNKFGKKIEDLKISELGKGVLGTGFLLEFKADDKKERLILKSLFTENLGMDHFSDRAGSLLLAHDSYNKMEGHVKSKDVLALDEKKLNSIGDSEEFFILMEEAKGDDFFINLDRIKESGMNEKDEKKILVLSDYLVEIHKIGERNETLYRRKIRDTIGKGGSLMGVLDMHPDECFYKYRGAWMEIIRRSISHWERARRLGHRLCEIHGDYHPGNLWFENDKLTVLDRAGGRFGEPADDLTAFLINLIFYSIVKYGRFKGEYKKLFDLFWNNYFKKTKDREMRRVLAPYFAFRAAVITNPVFYNNEFFGNPKKARFVRRKMIRFARNVLRDKNFNPRKINFYLNY